MKLLSIILAICMMLATVNAALATHTNEECEVPLIEYDDVTNFFVQEQLGTASFKPLRTSIQEGETLPLRAFVQFAEETPDETVVLEVGMYPADSAQNLEGLAQVVIGEARDVLVSPTANCVEGEEFVDTAHLKVADLDPGNPFAIIDYEIQAPVDGSLNNGGNREYIIQAVMFKNCYADCFEEQGGLPIYWWVEEQRITLTNDPGLSANTDDDGITNAGETDIDCGGDSDNKCGAGRRCEVNSDCMNGLQCIEGNPDICSTPTAEQPPTETPFLYWIAAGIALLGIYFLLSKKRRR